MQFKGLKLDHTTKCANQNLMHKILWDFEIEMDCRIPIRKLDLVLKKLSSRGFYHSSGPSSENKRKQKDRKILGPCYVNLPGFI